MKNKSKQLLAASLHGMEHGLDGRTYKTMRMFLQGTCKNMVHLVDEPDAEVDIIDADLMSAEASLQHCLARTPIRPIIVLSLQPVDIKDTIYVKKPANMESMIWAFKEARKQLQKQERKQERKQKKLRVPDQLDKSLTSAESTAAAEPKNSAPPQKREMPPEVPEEEPLNLAGRIAVSLQGMDEQAHQTMLSFLQKECKGIAQVVKEHEAEIDIIDADLMDAKVSLDYCLARQPLRPIILLSLEALKIENTIYVKKPLTRDDMVAAFQQAGHAIGLPDKTPKVKASQESAKTEAMIATFKEVSTWERKKKTGQEFQKLEKAINKASKTTVVKQSAEAAIKQSAKVVKQREPKQHQAAALATKKKTYTRSREQKKIAKHQAAMMINEKDFSNFIGIVSGVDFSDPEQWQMASYNPKLYYQGYVQSSIKLAYEKGQSLKLSSAWKALTLLPDSHEIWLNADDKQLRSFAGVEVKSIPVSTKKIMSIAPVNNAKEKYAKEPEKLQDINAFLWKLSCWTSKGRYINTLNLVDPLYLTQWPNFTRVMITPHAMRISALLIAEARSVKDIIEVLKIKPQYVFIFISAAYTVGILEQMKKQDIIPQMDVPVVKKVQKKGLLSRILNKLRG